MNSTKKVITGAAITVVLRAGHVCAEETKRVSVDEWISAAESLQAIRCDQYKYANTMALKKNDKQAAAMAGQGIGFSCECMPKQLGFLASARPAQDRTKVVSFEESNPVLVAP